MLHGTRIEDGVAEMFHLDQLEIQPGEAAVFEPGGNHFMLMGLKRPLRDGDNAVLNLDFGDGGTVSISVSVRRVAAEHTAHH
jgi:copper(I)-binding protein